MFSQKKYRNVFENNCFFIYIVAFLITLGKVFGLEILDSVGPYSIRNGSVPRVIIDCPYELQSEADLQGLVIKWYFNNRPFPVYQWIPKYEPQSRGVLRDRLDLSYKASTDIHKKYRALAILNPTTELSGIYSCWVSTFEDEVKMDAILTVFTPANDFSMTIERLDEESMSITCSADGLSPHPNLTLLKMESDSGNYELQEAETDAKYSHGNGTFEIMLEKTYLHEDLGSENDFCCSLTIPNSEYKLDETMLYYPELTTTTTTTTTTTSTSTSTTTPTPTPAKSTTTPPNPAESTTTPPTPAESTTTPTTPILSTSSVSKDSKLSSSIPPLASTTTISSLFTGASNAAFSLTSISPINPRERKKWDESACSDLITCNGVLLMMVMWTSCWIGLRY